MEKDTKRAVRRHHVARLKNTRRSYMVVNWWGLDDPKRLGMVVQYPKMCSCIACGNSRKWFGHRTVDEKRGFDIMEDGLEEWYDKGTNQDGN